MGYKVVFGETEQGHFETKKKAYDFIKNDLCKGKMPYLVHTSPGGIERFDWLLGVISVVPNPYTSEPD